MKAAGEILGKILASVAALVAFFLLARFAPFQRTDTALQSERPRAVEAPSPIDPWAPVEVLVRGLPLHSSSQPVADCAEDKELLLVTAGCRDCRIIVDNHDQNPAAVLWMEPTAELDQPAWRLRAEILVCGENRPTGTRFSYRSVARSVDEVPGLREPLPQIAGSREILRVGHPGWRLIVDEVVDDAALEAATLDLLAKNFSLLRDPDEETMQAAVRLLQRGPEICLLSQQFDSGQSYLISLYRRDSFSTGEV